MLPLYSCCSRLRVCCYVVFCRVQPIFNHHYKLRDLSLPCSCVLCRVLLRWINTYYLCAVFVPGSVPYVLRYGTFYLCLIVFIRVLCSGMQFWISCTTEIEHYKCSIILGGRQIFCSCIFIHCGMGCGIES